MSNTKVCSMCNETLPLDKFYFETKIQRHRSECKSCHTSVYKPKNNSERMWVNGKYIPKTHPLHKPGRFKTLDDAWSHTEIDTRSTEGEVYIIRNKAWTDWYKVGKAVNSEDRLQGYQTSSPFRDYVLEYYEHFNNRHQAESAIHRLLEKHKCCLERRGEWFKTYIPVIQEVMNEYRNKETGTGHRDEPITPDDLAVCDAGC